MKDIRVVQRGKFWIVLVNFIQRGVNYTSEAIANKEKEALLKKGIY